MLWLRLSYLLSFFLLFPLQGDAQIVAKLQWDQPATNLAEANGFTYKAYVGTTSNTLTGVTCVGNASPFVCTSNLPSLPSGVVNIRLTATSGLLESPQSPPFQVTVPGSPSGTRIVAA